MNTLYKILILLACLVGAVAAVFIFARTRMTPPSSFHAKNMYPKVIEASVDSLDDYQNISDMRLAHLKLDDKIHRFHTENGIEREQADQYTLKINKVYGEELSDYGLGLFNRSTWNDGEIKTMVGWVNELNGAKLSSGDPAIPDDVKDSFAKINQIYNSYNEALRLANSTGFSSISDAKAKIDKVGNYKNDPYLKNNTSLMNALSNLPGKLAQSHYNYVERLVSSLNGYRSMSPEHFSNLATKAENALNEYNKTGIYGSGKPSASGLSNKLNCIEDDALYYFYE